MVGYDESHDIAVLQLSGASGLTTATTGDSSTVEGRRQRGRARQRGRRGRHPVGGAGLGHRAQPVDHRLRRGLGIVRAAHRADRDQRRHPGRRLGRPAGERPRSDHRDRHRGLDAATSSAGSAAATGSAGSAAGSATAVGFGGSGAGSAAPGSVERRTPGRPAPVRPAARRASRSRSTPRCPSPSRSRPARRRPPCTSARRPSSACEIASSTSRARQGVALAGAASGTPAATAGPRPGRRDHLARRASRSAPAPTSSKILVGHHPGDKVSIGWTDSSGQSHTATVTLASGPTA